jgi:hypothetical protein
MYRPLHRLTYHVRPTRNMLLITPRIVVPGLLPLPNRSSSHIQAAQHSSRPDRHTRIECHTATFHVSQLHQNDFYTCSMGSCFVVERSEEGYSEGMKRDSMYLIF